ncbi:MAG: hypothetical protein [Olavius algarvensis Delta 4 endosymbiont]|nr:MAG: hypothetical protein [Olavius algarvensis Delta 4 endosymbiont]
MRSTRGSELTRQTTGWTLLKKKKKHPKLKKPVYALLFIKFVFLF